MSRRYSDAELDAALGDPPDPTTLDDVHQKLIDIDIQLGTANEHLSGIKATLWWIALLAALAVGQYLGWWEHLGKLRPW